MWTREVLGMAFDKSAMRRQLTLMKDMGANALRTSHNCPAPEVLDLCDEMGIVVWDECFDKWDGTAGRRADENLEEYVTRNLQAFVRRDKNHPCVVIWSMSNEIGEGANGLTRERCWLFREKTREVDTTRPISISFTERMGFPAKALSATAATDSYAAAARSTDWRIWSLARPMSFAIFAASSLVCLIAVRSACEAMRIFISLATFLRPRVMV